MEQLLETHSHASRILKLDRLLGVFFLDSVGILTPGLLGPPLFLEVGQVSPTKLLSTGDKDFDASPGNGPSGT